MKIEIDIPYEVYEKTRKCCQLDVDTLNRIAGRVARGHIIDMKPNERCEWIKNHATSEMLREDHETNKVISQYIAMDPIHEKIQSLKEGV